MCSFGAGLCSGSIDYSTQHTSRSKFVVEQTSNEYIV